MDTKSIWDFLSGISVGHIVAWVSSIAAAVSALCAGTIKLYKIFVKYEGMKRKDKEQEDKIASYDAVLKKIEKSLECIQKSLDEQKGVNLKQIRHTIVHTCEDALDRGEITSSKLNSLEEMYEEYVDIFHGNGYVKTLITKVRKEVKIVGKIDE